MTSRGAGSPTRRWPKWSTPRSPHGHVQAEEVFADWTDDPLAHLPSGSFPANAAWLAHAAISCNLLRAAGTLANLGYAKARGTNLRRDLTTSLPAPPATAAATSPSTCPRAGTVNRNGPACPRPPPARPPQRPDQPKPGHMPQRPTAPRPVSAVFRFQREFHQTRTRDGLFPCATMAGIAVCADHTVAADSRRKFRERLAGGLAAYLKVPVWPGVLLLQSHPMRKTRIGCDCV
jgi:hypothetical protein